MANIVLPFVTTFNDKGVKQGQASLAALAKSSLAGAVSVGVVVDQLGKAVRAAAEDQKAQEQLELAVRNNTDANTAQIQAMEDTIGRMEMQKAVADDELRPALGNLVRATGDVAKAQGLLNLALDISAATGRDLQTVTLALSKAQTGQIGALTRLGIPLDAAAVKSKDLEAIQADLAARFAGASDAAAASADGGMKKLQIALDNTYEAVGYRLLPVLGDYVTVLGDIASKTLDAEKNNNGFFQAFVTGFKTVFPMVRAVELLNKVVRNQADELTNARGKQYDYTTIAQRMNMGVKELTVTTEKDTKAQKKSTDAKAKAAETTKRHTQRLKEYVQTALDRANDSLEEATANLQNFAAAQKDAITSTVSLAEAFSTHSQGEQAYSEALQKRKEAYDALEIAKTIDDAEGYYQALRDVSAAEQGVTKAQKDRKSYGQTFADQIASAKKFATNLQNLVQNFGLSQEGLAQLINLGPVAGGQVTDELIAGTGSLTVGGLNQQLGELSSVAGSFGQASGSAFFGGALSAAQANQGTINNFNIQVQTVTGDKLSIAKEIVAALKEYEKRLGSVPIKVG